jgi:hypothetical protein
MLWANALTISAENALFPDLPEAITSFGAVSSEGFVYVYGGHTGEAHSYSTETTLGEFWRLSIKSPTQWESLKSDIRVQGTSLLAHNNFIFRVGGLSVRNKQPDLIGDQEKQGNTFSHLYSLDDFARYDIGDNEWKSLPPMPRPRSSHDAVLAGSQIFVLGGWNLNGNPEHSEWFENMFVFDISGEISAWRVEPQPFKRRAIAVTSIGKKIYAIGGMDTDGDTSNLVNVYDTIEKVWTKGPSLPNGPMKGFGAAACANASQLYVTHYAGTILELSKDHQNWLEVGQMKPRRFFHRTVMAGDDGILAMGGANRIEGHLATVQQFIIK